jgi:hypothetical protein
MREARFVAAAVALLVGIVALPTPERATAQPASPTAATPDALRPAAAFAGIADQRARSLALFQEGGKVLQHPRCVNCHPASDNPHQTDRMRPHQPMVVRGPDGHGTPTLPCNTCHGPTNFDPARVPGHPEWHLAPASMAWEGRSLGQICDQIKDRARNGSRDLAAIVQHVTDDSLVGWAWAPGSNRTPAPGTQAEFGRIMRAWADAGAYCPTP